ncbi:hypothetical protein KI387_037327 [Taxus chinensis]|uniref:Uncharacterized protein n=1 Tax=Taxus chinensis TaxID=29808 RepID=A0AA38FS22_TAXCH|nr:hypothetical protein KI387_037327 [Taxus chinensis]
MKRSNSRGLGSGSAEEKGDNIEWELRPGGMLVQRRDDGATPAGPMIKVKVSHGSYQHEVSIPAQATFGDLKKLLAQETGLEPQEQRLLFRGKEKENDECLHIAGVKDMAKVILLEDPASKERKLEEMRRNEDIAKACKKIAAVRTEVDKLSEQVSAVETAVSGRTKVADQDFVVITEMLMVQLLKLDGIEAEGEAKAQRRIEVRRVQNYVDTMDALKAENANPLRKNTVAVATQWDALQAENTNQLCNNTVAVTSQWNALKPENGNPLCNNTVAVTTQWETFDSGVVADARRLVEKWWRENPNPTGELTIEAENPTQVVEAVSPSPTGEPMNDTASLDRDGAQVSDCVNGSTQENDGSD